MRLGARELTATTPVRPSWWEASWFAQNRQLVASGVHTLSLITALALWIISLPMVNLREMTDLGLITVLPTAYYIAVGIVISSACLLLRNPTANTTLLLAHIVSLIFMFHATPTLLYGSLRYSWAWKHVGIVDYIHRFGVVNPTIAEMNVYHNWPGFFTLSAFLDQASGLTDPLGYAPWATVFFNLMALGALLLIFQSLTTDQRLVWFSLLLYFVTSWVGQDYYAPQAFAYVLHLAIIGVCLRWFRVTAPPDRAALKRWLRFNRIVDFYCWIVRHTAPVEIMSTPTTPVRRAGLFLLMTVFVIVIVTSHQLTPIMTLTMLTSLLVFRQFNNRYLPVFTAVFTLAWIFFAAEYYAGDVIESTVESMVRPSESVQLISLDAVSREGQIIAIVGRILTVSVWGLAGLGFLRKLLLDSWDVAPVMLAFVPFALMAANNYGGEMIFRVYMFTLPFMVYLGASLFYPDAGRGRNLLTTALMLACVSLLTIGFFFPYYGKDNQYYFSPEEIAAGQYIVDNAPEGSLIVEGTRNYPSRYHNYEYYTYVAISREDPDSQAGILADPVGVMQRWMSNPDYTDAYLIITKSQKVEVAITGPMPPRSLERIESALLESPLFKVVFQNRDAIIFALNER